LIDAGTEVAIELLALGRGGRVGGRGALVGEKPFEARILGVVGGA
jgi:hypothetical protein